MIWLVTMTQTAQVLDTKQEANVPEEVVLSEGQRATLVKMATMLINGVPDGDVASSYGLTGNEWAELRKTNHFLEVYSDTHRESLEQANDIDGSWNRVEQLATKRLSEKVAVTHDPAVLLRMASVANGAKRKADKRLSDGVDGSNASKPATVNITLNQAFIAKLPTMNAEKEYVLIAHKNSERKQHDSLNTEVVTKLLEQDANASEVGNISSEGAKNAEPDIMEGWLENV